MSCLHGPGLNLRSTTRTAEPLSDSISRSSRDVLPTNPTQVETWRESGFKALVGANRLLLSGARKSATSWLLAGKPLPITQVAQIVRCGRLDILLMVREFMRDATAR